jgi:hypothetical protein
MKIEQMRRESRPAFEKAVADYIQSRRKRVPEFVRKHFSFKGALHINKKAFSDDLYKVPLNVAWTVPYLGLRVSSSLLRKLRLGNLSERIDSLPPGFETRVQKEINWLIYTELLELPYSQDGRTSHADALLFEFLKQPKIAALFARELSKIHSKSRNPGYRAALEKNLVEYSKNRTAAADLAGNIISLSAGVAAFGKMTPGSLTVGGTLATLIANQIAISNFFLGPTLGGLYYTVFPAAASAGLVAATTGTMVIALAMLTSFSGIITDPLQSRLGIHRRRLIKLIDCLENQLKGNDESHLKIRDQYYARVFDLFDLLKRAAQTFV